MAIEVGREPQGDQPPETAALILGAGWSYVAGLPLAGGLFDDPPRELLSWARLFAGFVPEAYRQWRVDNPEASAEQFIGRVYSGSVPLRLNDGLFPYHSSAHMQLQLPEPPGRYEKVWRLDWRDMAEYLQLRLAWPDEELRWGPDIRYRPLVLRPSRCFPQIAAIDDCLKRYELVGVVTTNYDVLTERVLDVKSSRLSPGFNYGRLEGAYRPPNTPFARERQAYEKPTGKVRLAKLHGSLNWSLESGSLNIYCDLRAAFRGGGTAAIVPPLPEKYVPDYLAPVWQDAFETLSEAETWIVIGYSLPHYDRMVRDLFGAAYRGQRIEIQDPNAKSVAESFLEVAPGASFDLQEGLQMADPEPVKRRRVQRRRKLGGPTASWTNGEADRSLVV
jgi:hypothetical protein